MKSSMRWSSQCKSSGFHENTEPSSPPRAELVPVARRLCGNLISVSFSPHPSFPYSEFRQACRAFKPSELIPAIACVSASLGEPPYPNTVKQRMPPWGLAAAARESLLYGNEYRSKTVDGKALEQLMDKFQNTRGIGEENVGKDDFLVTLMTRLTYEQFPYQESIFEELARSHAWIVEGLSDVETKVITEDSLTTMLDGVPFQEAVATTFLLQVRAWQNGGVYDPRWLDQPEFTKLLKIYSRTNIEKMASRLTTTPARFRTEFSNLAGTTKATRFDYNPLISTPFVDMGNGVPVAPAPRLILRTVTPGGLYYAGMKEHGNTFAEDLGVLFEHYIGRQLKLIEGADVEPEIKFGKGGGSKSVDWFVILPKLVILVEVKSRRLGLAARAGDFPLISSLDEALGAPRKQLARTVSNLADHHPEFKHIPTDRPLLGLIVTAEPFYTGTAYLRDHAGSTVPGGALSDVPVAAVSARDIEWLVTHGQDVESILRTEIAKSAKEGGIVSLHNVGKKVNTENAILSDAWDTYPFLTRKGSAANSHYG